MDFEDLHFEKRPYSAVQAYMQSKLANILFTKELTRRIAGWYPKQIKMQSLNSDLAHKPLYRNNVMQHKKI